MLAREDLMLLDDLGSLSKDPYRFVLWAFDWGSGELEGETGPDEWQAAILISIRDGLLTINQAIQIAVASGHGIGKSALIAWIVLWGMSTLPDTKGVVTANTDTQLRTKTWPEVSKWFRLFIAKRFFVMTATSLYSADPAHEKTWRCDIIPWSVNNPEAFAGMHNQGKRILLLFDEASKIHDLIWEVAEGALTDENTEILWVAFGNPTRNTGRFRECFRKYRHRWKTQQIDSRTAKHTNKKQLQQWIDDYGVDSDFVKVRVLGQFPSQSDRQFISSDLVDMAKGRRLRKDQYAFAPVIITCDPAWTGGDETVIALRQGLHFEILKVIPKNDDDVMVANFLAVYEDDYKADAVVIDQGYGQGIYSIGKAMNRIWRLVSFGSSSTRPDCYNKRDEMWQNAKEWLKEGGSIPDDQVLYDDLVGPETVPRMDGKIKLESKEDMRTKGLPSPNRADALALSFAFPVRKKDDRLKMNQQLYKSNTQYSVRR